MAYGSRDPAEDLRIVRQSLLSTVGRLYHNTPKTPQEAIEIARIWEAYVYEGAPAASSNGAATFSPSMPVPTLPASGPVCAMCGAVLTPVTFKKGNTWDVAYLAAQGQAKYGMVLCKKDYFGKKPVA